MIPAHKVVEWISYGALIYMLAIVLMSFGAIIVNHFDHKKSQKRSHPVLRRAPASGCAEGAGAHKSEVAK